MMELYSASADFSPASGLCSTDEEGRMGEWQTVFQGEVEGRPVEIRVYESQDDLILS